MIKKTLAIITGVSVIALFAVVGNAQAWTVEDCPTPETHPDCLQYFPSPSPTVEPTVEPSATPSPYDKDDDQGRGDGPTGPQAAPKLPATGYGAYQR